MLTLIYIIQSGIELIGLAIRNENRQKKKGIEVLCR